MDELEEGGFGWLRIGDLNRARRSTRPGVGYLENQSSSVVRMTQASGRALRLRYSNFGSECGAGPVSSRLSSLKSVMPLSVRIRPGELHRHGAKKYRGTNQAARNPRMMMSKRAAR
jgi:hypothetical protein